MSVVKSSVLGQMGSILVGAGSSTGWRRISGLSAILAPLVAACGSVAGPDYVGEVTLELQGRLTSLGTDQTAQVPALAFVTPEGFYLVDGEVTGEFPDHFTLSVAEPPPKAALHDAGNEMGVKAAFGYLVVVTKDHPDLFPFDAPSLSAAPLSQTDRITGETTRTKTNCSKDGTRCETFTYVCKSEPCQPLLTETVDGSQSINGFECGPDSCLTYQIECPLNGDDLGPCPTESTDASACDMVKSCTRSVQLCDDREPNQDYISSDGTIERCELVKHEGVRPADGQWSDIFAQDLLITFVTEDVELGGVQLSRGYNLLRSLSHDDVDAWVKDLTCRLDAESAYAGDEPESSEELTKRKNEIDDVCRTGPDYERITNTADVELEIELGTPGSMQ